jgi:beta-galactosidase
MLGVCYYPEHWPENIWQQDAKEMADLGLTYVRIAEFSWSRLEPIEGEYHFEWLDKAIATLANEGLRIIMCTPTATPPKWLIDKHPDILPVDIHTGQIRGFGSRRHYDFSSEIYQQHAFRITEVLAKRYGGHPDVCGWQTDNEIACHDTTHSGSLQAKKAFQAWCQKKYQQIEALNKAWGTVFWSMEYTDFDQIELPILAVTETNPAHQLDYRRFSSDQVIKFHDKMIEMIRRYAKGQFVTHNFIPMADTQCDNFALAQSLDFASYDNYPLGRTDLFMANRTADEFKPYMRVGHPDYSSYSFDQVRGISRHHFWIMEQQPGPVNWAHHNPNPLPGMVRLWSWQAFAHGADCVCYFRWRQAPFAQEQMHAGIKRVDNSRSQAWYEIEQIKQELDSLGFDPKQSIKASVAMIMSTTNQWVTEIERQGDSYQLTEVEFAYYSALRQLGIAVDFISVDHDFSQYALIVAPCLPIIDQTFIDKCLQSEAHFVFGPRSGSKTKDFQVAPNLAPGLLQQLIPIQVIATETLRPDCEETLIYNNKTFKTTKWREQIAITPKDNSLNVLAYDELQWPMLIQNNKVSYIATLSCDDFLRCFFEKLAEQLNITTLKLPKELRVIQRGDWLFVLNFSAKTQHFPYEHLGNFILGNADIGAHDVAIIKLNHH